MVQYSIDVNEFHVLWFPILMSSFQPFVTDCKELRWDYVAGEPGHCAAVVLITVSSVTQGDVIIIMLYGTRLSFNHLMYFVFPENVCDALK